jgi:hypothetical protein
MTTSPGAKPGTRRPVPDQRTRTAWHEGGHIAARVHLLGAESVEAVSIRPGKSHLGITLLGSPPTDRRERELAIICTLAGDLAPMMFGLVEDGYYEPSPAEVAAVAATESLDKLAPLVRERLLEAEDDEESVPDELVAERAAWSLAAWFDDSEAAAHLNYLRVVASRFVERHTWAIRRVAEALLEHETLEGATVAEIVTSTRCVCHWRPKKKEETDMPFLSKKPQPEPPTGPFIAKPITLDHPHAMVATEEFWAGFVSHPGGLISPGRTLVREGMLADDRSPLVTKHRGKWRRPRKDERAG